MILERLYNFLPPSKAEQVMLYVLEHLDENFIFSRSYDQIQKDTGASQPTIAKVFKRMEEVGAAKHIAKSKWSLAAIACEYSDAADDNLATIYVEAKGS